MNDLKKKMIITYETASRYPAPSTLYILIYTILLSGLFFLYCIDVNEIYYIVVASLLIVYYGISTIFYANYFKINDYIETFLGFLINYYVVLYPLALELFLRINSVLYNAFYSSFTAGICLIVIIYTRNYRYLEEFVRLTSTIMSISLQHYFNAPLYVLIFSLLILVLYGRVGMQLIIFLFFKQKWLQTDLGIDMFYFFFKIYLWIYKVRSQRLLGIVFSLFTFTIFPNFLLYCYIKHSIVSFLFFCIFLVIILISATVYHGVVSTPDLAAYMLERAMVRNPFTFEVKLKYICEFLSKEDHYIISSDHYLMFNEVWLVEKYIGIKITEVRHWAKKFLEDYDVKFVKNVERDDFDIQVDRLVIDAMEYIIKTGNFLGTGAKKILGYEKAKHLLDEKVSLGSHQEKFYFCMSRDDELASAWKIIRDYWFLALSAFEQTNKEKGMKGYSFFRNPGFCSWNI